MKKSTLYSMFLFGYLLAGCSQIEYNHPLDSTITYERPDFFEDTNGDSIVNLWDTTSSQYKSHLDTVPPVLTLLAQNPTKIAYEDPNQIVKYLQSDKAYKVDDNRGRDNVTVEIRGTDFSVIFPNTNEVYYTARDKAGNSVTDTLIVIVLPQAFKDTIKPEISVSMADIQIYQNESFDPMKNVTAFDEPDGNITAKITITGSVDTTKPGVYTLTYKVKDNAGLEDILVRKITVIENTTSNDNIFPVITLTGGDTVEIEENAVWTDPGYKANDNIDGIITEKVQVSGTVKSTPGWYTITYTVSDKAMNITSKTRFVKRKGTGTFGDTTPPEISLKYQKDTVVTVIKGAVFKAPDVTILDNIDGLIPPTSLTFYPKTVNTSSVGTITVALLAEDKAGNEGRLDIKVKIVEGSDDKTPPVITLKGKNPDTVSVSAAATYTDAGATVTDNVDKNLTATVKGSVDRKTAGTYTLTYTAYDAANNVDSVKRIVVVKQSSSSDLLELYGVPQAKALASISGDFKSGQVEGTGGPNLSNLTKMSFKFRNEQYSKGFDEFAITVNGNYKELKSLTTHTFESPNPGFKLTGSGVTNLDGEYYVTGDATKFVWVKIDGSFAIIWEP